MVLVIGGDGNDLVNLSKVLKESLPVIVIAGSGGAADFIALALASRYCNSKSWPQDNL